MPRPPDLARFGLPAPSTFRCRYTLAWTLGQLGDFDEAVAHGKEAVHGCEAADDRFGLATGCNILGTVYLDRGDVGQAIPLFERGLEVSLTSSLQNALVWATSLLGAAHTLAGHASVAVPLLEQALETASANTIVSGYPLWAVWLGEAYLAAGRIADASQMATTALDAALDRKERASQAFALRALGEIASRLEPPDLHEAERHYRQALALAEELGMRPLQARCRLGLGTALHAAGRSEEARAELSTALEMLRAMGMAHWVPEAEAALAAVAAAAKT